MNISFVVKSRKVTRRSSITFHPSSHEFNVALLEQRCNEYKEEIEEEMQRFRMLAAKVMREELEY